MSLFHLVRAVFGPVGADVISPWHWTDYNEESRHELTFQLTRIVIGIREFQRPGLESSCERCL